MISLAEQTDPVCLFILVLEDVNSNVHTNSFQIAKKPNILL